MPLPCLIVIAYLLGVLAPEVFLRVAMISLPIAEEGVTLNESMLEFDCTILLWIISALRALSDPKDGLDDVYSCC